MPKVDLRKALAEKDERDGDLCRSCEAPADDQWAPYCSSCGSYWREVEQGIFEEAP